MGDFVRHRDECVHDVLVEDSAGEKIGLIRVSASIHLLNVGDPIPEPLPAIVASLEEQGGLAGIPYTDERSPAAFTEWAESTHGVKVTFREVRPGPG